MQGRTKTNVKKEREREKTELYNTFSVIVYTDILTSFYKLYNYF